MSSASNKSTVASRTVTASASYAEGDESAPLGDALTARPTPAPALQEGKARLTPRAVPASPTTNPSRARATETSDVSAPAESAPDAPQPGQEREEARRSLERRIRAHLTRGALTLTLTDNRYTMISVRRENDNGRGRHYKVRLHHMFVHAPPATTRALARYIAHNDRESSRMLGAYIDANQHQVRSRERRASNPRLITRGRYHDLREIYDDLNERYFDNRIEARITWGQRTGKPKRRNSIKMGSYSVEDRLIRIHRSLDRAFVPRFFVEWIVYHEMLHQVHEIKVVNGRRQFHTREFLRDEAMFEHYAAAREWERSHLDALLTC
ncbi:hypothetical protein [Haliangium ochraceum]|uniref:SprT-like domain-containing protein n=1 Tax=Haliangium ochraceum (strain DSM 14365 / JCM 11303 / SMP-2) TaxID=502025 RepID=D0LTM6_HALO1|nr:hypothetical protein [Haliangium ochraceum]ACY15720.1 hypothetical protein Hoch_3218 [Haliangium ochraceum DSM 14365]